MTTTKKTPAKGSWSRGNTKGEMQVRRRRQIIARRYMSGKTPKQIAQWDSIPVTESKRVIRELEAEGLSPGLDLLTVQQASVLMGVIPRRTRLLCQQGRIGRQLDGRTWVIERDDLLEFLQREHSIGQAGRQAVEEDIRARAETN